MPDLRLAKRVSGCRDKSALQCQTATATAPGSGAPQPPIIGYLFVLFSLIGDPFRDQRLNGWARAAWVILLVSLPALTALVHLIARGRGTGERGQAQAARHEDAQAAYITSVAGETLKPRMKSRRRRRCWMPGRSRRTSSTG